MSLVVALLGACAVFQNLYKLVDSTASRVKLGDVLVSFNMRADFLARVLVDATCTFVKTTLRATRSPQNRSSDSLSRLGSRLATQSSRVDDGSIRFCAFTRSVEATATVD
jgi:hypothetical protein